MDAGPEAAFILENPYCRGFFHFIAGHSTYLTELIQRHWPLTVRFFHENSASLLKEILNSIEQGTTPEETKRILRIAKQKISLITALADITGRLGLFDITGALSDFAEQAIRITLNCLLSEAYQKKQISHSDANRSGIVILGMGKLGGRELNYSSDIDLIVLYDAERLPFIGGMSRQHFMTRLTQDMVGILQDRTADGYVFRTDLRLRPDPASTPPAITLEAATRYYETVGQNWERAAMIKARQVAGDPECGDRFQRALQPFIWRRHLDFAAINDILSIKRQMHAPQEGSLHLPGHNIKTGHGGIREIEFLVQIYQLIWGGRLSVIRRRPTLEALEMICEEFLIEEKKKNDLNDSYYFLRTLEHRLQMVADQQTHSLPLDMQSYQKIAGFMGFEDFGSFSDVLRSHLDQVNTIYSDAFKDTIPLESKGNLMFTGVDHDPETLKTLREFGFSSPESVSEKIMDWHKGGRRSTRTPRARTLLTELVPALLEAFSSTPDPDDAFMRFDDFLSRLPSGVQLFSLYHSRPELMTLTAEIFGFSPPLAETLSHNPQLFDAVILGGFYNTLPTREYLAAELEEWLAYARNEEEVLQRLHTYTNEKRFQAGVHLLKRLSTAQESGRFLSDLADVIVRKIIQIASENFAIAHGTIPEGELLVLALGKWGCHESTLISDLDMIFLFDVPEDTATSNGEKPLMASAYYHRLAQRIIGILTALTREGRLYEVDTRLRPFGKDGPLVVTIDAFNKYYTESAWLVEKLALIRARLITPDISEAAKKLLRYRHAHLEKPYNVDDIRASVSDIRKKILEQYPTDNPWNVKYVKGGLMDLENYMLCMVLGHAHQHPILLQESTDAMLTALTRSNVISDTETTALRDAHQLLFAVHAYVRLFAGKEWVEENATEGIKELFAAACGKSDFNQLKQSLLTTESIIEKKMNF
ncbi:MAG: bifunctional [glutamine synthetase] adenylyltransferase/[glutamine synthetase]-adenylyl-L-tyrosine phosphorylase [Rickettsiales bacterium]